MVELDRDARRHVQPADDRLGANDRTRPAHGVPVLLAALDAPAAHYGERRRLAI
jgi:hypothetical protein